MSTEAAPTTPRRKLRLGLIGGAPPSFIGRVHRIAARYDDAFDIVGGVFSSNAETNRHAGIALGITADRNYGNAEDMAAKESARSDKVDLISILTPSASHFAIAQAFTARGFNILSEKPVTTSTADALALIALQQRVGNVFAVAHAYTGYTMVRHARRLMSEGVLGPLRVVQVEYAQGWLATPVERTGDKIARNRTDPHQNGRAGCLNAIGTHAFNIASYVSGLELDAVAATASAFVQGRAVPDNVQVQLQYAGGVSGAMWLSQVAAGYDNSLRLRLIGERGSLEWSHDDPNHLSLRHAGGPEQILRRGGQFVDGLLRAPAGHPEGFIDAFANLYAGVAGLIHAATNSGAITPTAFPVPDLIDGARAVCFADAAYESTLRGGEWVDARLRLPSDHHV